MANCRSNPQKRIPNSYDMREIMKKELLKQDELQYNGFGGGEIVAPMSIPKKIVEDAPKKEEIVIKTDHGFDSTELYFDSIYRNQLSEIQNGEIIWDVIALNNNKGVSAIIVVEIGNFYFPKINLPSTVPDFFYFGKVYIEFLDTASQQTVRGVGSQKFHIECDIENINGQAVKLVPVRNTFYFTQPITEISEFHVRFMIPETNIAATLFKNIPIPKETVLIQSATTGGFGYNPIRFQMINSTTSDIGLVGVLTAPGVAVFISNYVSNDAATNISVNSTSGLFVTNIIDNITFEIAGIDASAVSAVYSATMFIPKNRIAFPVRFTSVTPMVTNHVDINQR